MAFVISAVIFPICQPYRSSAPSASRCACRRDSHRAFHAIAKRVVRDGLARLQVVAGGIREGGAAGEEEHGHTVSKALREELFIRGERVGRFGRMFTVTPGAGGVSEYGLHVI